MLNKIISSLEHLRTVKPLVLCLTNFVTMDFMANSLLALGAAPIMSADRWEIEELIKTSDAINLNIGTLNVDFIDLCQNAASLAKLHKKPLIFDPVGAGASLIRTQSARNLMASADILRGNASEIIALYKEEYQTRGVESTHQVENAQNAACCLATTLKTTVIVSGKTDLVTNGIERESLEFGSPLMPMVTGMGCALTAVIAAFRAVIEDSYEAGLVGTAYFGLCGNLAAERTNGPGSFRTVFIDMLYNADRAMIEDYSARNPPTCVSQSVL